MPDHRLILTGPPGSLAQWQCRCSCGAWSVWMPDVGAWGHRTAAARIAQARMFHHMHAKGARKAEIRPVAPFSET